MCNERGGWGDGCGCEKNLKVNKLCAKCIKADEICAHCMKTGKLEAGSIKADRECVSGDLQASTLHAGQAFFNKLCSKEATLDSLCVNNLKVGNPNPLSTPYRATVNYSADATYTLGSFLNFDNIVDDPNNNITLLPNTTYTAPFSGYYVFSFKVNIDSLLTASGDPILGVPVANPLIYVNGLLVREAYSPFLAFFNEQKVMVDGLITMQAGDQLTMKYDVLAGNGVPVVGTVNIVGAGIEDGNSLFKIVFLSDLSPLGPIPPGELCEVCPDVVIECDDDPCCHKGLGAPHLNAIAVDPAAPRNYVVSWGAVADADSYTLEQSMTSDFANPTIVAQGNLLSQSFVGQANGTYWYRVFASNADDNSAFSKAKSVVISGALLARPAAARPASASRSAARPRSNWVRPR